MSPPRWLLLLLLLLLSLSLKLTCVQGIRFRVYAS